ncbi:MAG: hypothetical protein GXY47_14460 [Acidobacteria bacterium]|nr:hypothetical protein [Acidobacteriota bacterium]
MATRIGRSWSFTVVICASLILGALHSAGWAVQEPGRPPTTESQRREAIERLRQQMQRTRPAAAETPAAPAAAAPVETAPPSPPSAPVPEASRIRYSGGQKVTLNFDNLPLYDFVNQVGAILGLTPIVIDSDVRGNVNLVSASPMAREDIFPLFNLILKSKNAALIEQRGIYQIVPISSALKSGVDIIEQLPEPAPAEAPEAQPDASGAPGAILAVPPAAPGAEGSGPRLMTHVIRAEFVPVKDLIEPIKLFMTEGGVIMPYERLNMLIMTDYSDSAAKVLQIIRMLDSSYLDPDLVELVKVENNSSADVAEDLAKIFGSGGKDEATGISFASLDRMNTIFVMASTRRGLEEVKRWIRELDATSGKKFQTFVYVVQNSTASNIAMMVAALFGGEESSSVEMSQPAAGTTQQQGAQGFGSSSSRQSAFGSSSNLTGSQGSLTGGQGFGSGGYDDGYMGSGSFGSSQRLGPQLNVSRSITSQILRGGTFSGLQDIVRLVVDDINNSLIIQSTPADYAYISETIKKMDVLPRQAIIDARIFEVDLTDDLSFGVNAELQARTEGNLTTGGISPTSGKLSANTFAFVGNSRQIMLALEALRTKTRVKILEAPSVLALDGTQASIIVGSEIPYPAGSFTTTSGSTTNVQYRDTGISLIVVPRISASGSVTLDITQEVSSIGAGVEFGDGQTAPTFSKTNVMTTLSVKDGETVAIAGLIRDKNDVSRGGIPFLSDIPILGSLFGATVRKNHRTELIILITPHVIRTVERFQEMTQELKDSLRNVRKLADEKEEEQVRDIREAREERYEKEQKRIKKIKPAREED